MKFLTISIFHKILPVYGGGATSRQRNRASRRAFLLIELLVALATVAVFSCIVAFVQAQAWRQYHEANRYLKAVNLITGIFEHMNHDPKRPAIPQTEEFSVQIKEVRADSAIPFKMVTVIVSWNVAGGSKELAITGGVVDFNEQNA